MTRRRALLSVSDKTGIAEFGRALAERGWEVLSTGGTARALAAAGVPVTEVSVGTGHPEMMDGRVKTLHPCDPRRIARAAGLSGRHGRAVTAGLCAHRSGAVNLYPFRETVAAPDVTLGEAMENVDIGGPTLIRAAAKNHRGRVGGGGPGGLRGRAGGGRGGGGWGRGAGRAAAPARGQGCFGRFRPTTGRWRLSGRQRCGSGVCDAIELCSLTEQSPRFDAQEVTLALTRRSLPRYGENPGQEAGFYAPKGAPTGIAELEQLHGKGLSYNNLLDLDGALLSLAPFAFALEPTVCFVKHTTPCGLALRPTLPPPSSGPAPPIRCPPSGP